MSAHALQPAEGERGLASYDLADLAALLAGAWDDFIEVVDHVELSAPSRLRGWTAHDVCVHLGSWPGRRSMERLVEEARSGHHGEHVLRGQHADAFDQDGHNEALIDAHREAGRDEVVDALVLARDEVGGFLTSEVAVEVGGRQVRSMLGPLPLLTVVAAMCYELAVHALDLAPAGAPDPPARLLDAGLAAVTDVTGGLAARHGIDATIGVVSPEGGWAFGTSGADWTTMNLPMVPPTWPAVEAPAALLLDASAGRRQVPLLLARRELKVHHVTGLLALAPIVEEVPGLPGAHALGGAVRHLSGVGRLVRRLPRLGL